jgi:hypothetical protein
MDLGNHLFGRAEISSRAIDSTPEIIDDDLGTMSSQAERVFAPDSPAGPGDDRHP